MKDSIRNKKGINLYLNDTAVEKFLNGEIMFDEIFEEVGSFC